MNHQPFRDCKLDPPTYFGDISRLHIADSAWINNTHFNLSSGDIHIGSHVGIAQFCKLVTGKHDYMKTGRERNDAIVPNGRDIFIEPGVWIGTGAIIIGPCRIGKNAVIAAGSVVWGDIPSNVLVAGNPAKIVKVFEPNG